MNIVTALLKIVLAFCCPVGALRITPCVCFFQRKEKKNAEIKDVKCFHHREVARVGGNVNPAETLNDE